MTRPSISRGPAFWMLAALLALFLFAASAPSPLYPLYAARYGFSSVTVTAIFAVYAIGALTALLLTGRLSDHLGRRPVVMGALAIQAAGMGAFILADGVAALYLGRVLQGIGTGIASAAISAWLLDLQPAGNPRLGGLVGGIAPMAGLGTGALGTALLVRHGPSPLRLVFWLLAGVYALAFLVLLVVPDVSTRVTGWLASMRPRIAVPPPARASFVALAPSLVAIWALAALYASLGPALANSLSRTPDPIAGAIVIAAVLAVGAVASAFVRDVDAVVLVRRGSLVVLLGVAASLAAVALGSLGGLYAASAVAGVGFGPAFSGIVRSLAPLAPTEQRNALFAAIYLLTYLSISVPAVAAGVAAGAFGLVPTTYVYGAVVIALAATTTVVAWRGGRSATR